MKKILSLLLCALLLGASTASAANPQDALVRDHALAWTLTLNPDADVLLPLLQGDTPLTNEPLEAFQHSESVQAASEAVKTLAEGIAGLRLGGSFAPWALSLSLGTDQAELASASLWADAKTGGNGITTDLLDCLFFLPQDKAKPVLDQAAYFLSLNIPDLISPYLRLLQDEADKLLNGKTAEQGNYPLGELGNFDVKISITITTHDVAWMLRSLLTAFESDFALQTAINKIMNLSRTLEDNPMAQGSVVADISIGLKDFIAQTLALEEEDLLELSAYSRKGLDSLCYVIDTTRVREEVALFLAVLPGKQQGGLVLTAGDGAKLEKLGTAQGVDWEKVRIQATEGSGQLMEESAHLALLYSVPEDEPLALSLWAYSAGVPLFGITAEHNAEQADPYQSKTSAQLSVLGKDPALSLGLTLQESDTLPTLPDTNNWPVLSLMDDNLANKADTGSLPTLLLRRLSAAYPDTAEELIKAIQVLGQ